MKNLTNSDTTTPQNKYLKNLQFTLGNSLQEGTQHHISEVKTKTKTIGIDYASTMQTQRDETGKFVSLHTESAVLGGLIGTDTRRQERFENLAAALAKENENRSIQDISSEELNDAKAILNSVLKQKFGADFKEGQLSYKHVGELNKIMQEATQKMGGSPNSLAVLRAISTEPMRQNVFKTMFQAEDIFKGVKNDGDQEQAYDKVCDIDTLYDYVAQVIDKEDTRNIEDIIRPEPQNTEEKLKLLEGFAENGKWGKEYPTFPNERGQGSHHWLAGGMDFNRALSNILALHEALSAEDVNETNLAERAFVTQFAFRYNNSKSTFNRIDDVYQYVSGKLKQEKKHETDEQKLKVLREFSTEGTWDGSPIQQAETATRAEAGAAMVLQETLKYNLTQAFALYDVATKGTQEESEVGDLTIL